ncbi:hypothetical protein F3K39_20790 [Streptomyces sp. LBUM 1479]|nr:hypothetical protein [Streptomyces sp. LBUM 1479]
MPCACQNRRQTFEVVPNAGTATRAAFTSSSQGTAEAVADRYPTSVVRDKKTGRPSTSRGRRGVTRSSSRPMGARSSSPPRRSAPPRTVARSRPPRTATPRRAPWSA